MGNAYSEVVEIVFEAVETLGLVGSDVGIERLCKSSNDGGFGHGGHLPVVSIKSIASPVNRDIAELLEDKTNTVVDITIRRTHVLEAESGGLHDGLLSPLHLGNDLLIGQGSEGMVGPGVRGQVVALGDLALDGIRVLDDIGTNQEESSRMLVRLQIIQQGRSGGGWTIVKGQTPGVRSSASCNIVSGASITSPVTLVWNRGVRAYRRIALMKRDAGGSRKVTNLLKPSQDLG